MLVIGVFLNARYPNVFETIAELATFATVFVWLMILFAQVAMRKQMTVEEQRALKFSVPFWPYGQYFSIAFILFTFGIMAWLPDFRLALGIGVAFTVIMTVLYFATGRPQVVAQSQEEYAKA